MLPTPGTYKLYLPPSPCLLLTSSSDQVAIHIWAIAWSGAVSGRLPDDSPVAAMTQTAVGSGAVAMVSSPFDAVRSHGFGCPPLGATFRCKT
jgi:hypothetical protein